MTNIKQLARPLSRVKIRDFAKLLDVLLMQKTHLTLM